MLTETIAAISTGGTNSGINIIRISGDKALEILSKIFTNYAKLDHQKIIYGKIIDNKTESSRGFGLSSMALHMLAMLFMLSDHLWGTVVHGNEWMTCIG